MSSQGFLEDGTHREFSWSVNRDKNQVRGSNLCVDVDGEEEVLAPRLLDHLLQARLVDGEVLRIPRVNLGSGNVHHSHADTRTFFSDDGHRWSTHIAYHWMSIKT